MVDITYRCKTIKLLSLRYFDENRVDAVRIMDEGILRLTGKFNLNEKMIFVLQSNDGVLLKIVWNNLIINKLEKAYGSETKKWIGKVLNVVKINNKGESYLDFIPSESFGGNV